MPCFYFQTYLRNVLKTQPFQEVGLLCRQGFLVCVLLVVLNLVLCRTFSFLLRLLCGILRAGGGAFVGVRVGFMEVQG